MHVILPCDIQVQLFLVQKMKIIMGRVCMWRKWKMEWLHARLMMWWEVESEKWIGCVRLMMWMTCMCFK